MIEPRFAPSFGRRAPRVLRGTACAAVVLAVVCAASCAAEAPPTVLVGDAIPRIRRDSSVVAVVAALLDSAKAPPLVLEPWFVSQRGDYVTESAQAERFASDSSVVAVVGHAGSQLTLMAAPTYRRAGMPLIVPTSTARALRAAGSHIFMLAPSDDAIGAFMVDRAIDSLHLERLGVMHVADAYGEGIRAGLASRAAARGRSLSEQAALTGMECAPDATAADAITRAFLRRVQPDGLFLALPQHLAQCVIRAAVAADSSVVILTSDSFVPPTGDDALSAREARAVHRVMLWEPGPDSLTRRFVTTYRRIVGRAPDAAQALQADALLLLAAALRDGRRSREDVEHWLRELGTPGHPPVPGITGPIEFTRPRDAGLRLKPVMPGDASP